MRKVDLSLSVTVQAQNAAGFQLRSEPALPQIAAEPARSLRPSLRALAFSPLVLLALAAAALLAILPIAMTLPVGAFYWDLFIYFDAANRILTGQLPQVDFFPPVGPLGYYLFTLAVSVFPKAQPLFLAQWSLLLVTAPLMALVVADVDRRSRPLAFALLAPFLVFSILPFNVEQYTSYPGVDGFGIYNRQCSEILYVLAAALIFPVRRRIVVATVAGAMLALFLTKITGFAVGGLLCAFAFLAGRVKLRSALWIVFWFALPLAFLELFTGMVSAYGNDVLTLLFMNDDGLFGRLLQSASMHFGVFASGTLLAAVLLFLGRKDLAASLLALARRPSSERVQTVFDRDEFWLGAALLAALVFDSQNTGDQAFIFVWPALLLVLLGTDRLRGVSLVVVFALAAAATMPTFVHTLQRAARAFVGQVHYVALEGPHLKTLGFVSQRPEIMARSAMARDIYAAHPATYEAFAANGQLPSFTLYTDPDFQLTWLRTVDEAVGAIEAYEEAHRVHFRTIFSLNFTNPFPWLMDREAPRLVSIGADPFRTVPDPNAAVLKAVADTDLVLYPKCPITLANETLRDLYEPALANHRRIELTPCWDAYVRNGLAGASAAGG